MKSDLLELAQERAELVKLPRKPPALNHPWRRSLKDRQTKNLSDLTNKRNSRWLNDWKPENHTKVLWTKEFYSIDELQEYGYRIDKSEGRAEQVKKHYKF